jgi:hypothetical protein
MSPLVKASLLGLVATGALAGSFAMLRTPESKKPDPGVFQRGRNETALPAKLAVSPAPPIATVPPDKPAAAPLAPEIPRSAAAADAPGPRVEEKRTTSTKPRQAQARKKKIKKRPRA